ncbi:GspE/PulE family protein [Patescibacteria group bacterium]|nr:GspE/PulE family protein [Patescibacteria group bacterium]
MISNKKLKELLEKNQILDTQKLDEADKEAKNNQQDLFNYLLEKGLISADILYGQIASFYNMPLIDLKNENIRKDILFLIPEPIAQTHEIIAFNQTDDKVKVATTDPTDLQTIEFIKKKIQAELELYLTTPESIQEALKQYHQSLEAEFENLADHKTNKELPEKDLKQLAQDLPIIRVVDTLLEYAIFENASDVHIEPAENNVLIRYRIDGILHYVMTLPKNLQSGLVARIKVLANLKLDEHRLPQDGRFKITTPQYKISFRVSIIPIFDGEKVVMRLLSESNKTLDLPELGLQKEPFEIVNSNIKKPHGIILVTGPTGSGKTTTLYTMMNKLNNQEVNIATVEDPIEYRMPRINQSQINPKIDFTFAKGLRAILRQDPDIIMVGEIRDKETAEIAINAAMTGHLVLSTLHTNNAASTPQRLINMGIQPFLISSTTNLIIAQRLVRKICKDCIISYNLNKETINQLAKYLDIKNVLQFLIKGGLVSNIKPSLDSILFYKGKGCKQCSKTGYKGRIGIYEILEITPAIADLINKEAPTDQIHAAALANNMITLMQDGFMKAVKAITSVEEVLRVSQE